MEIVIRTIKRSSRQINKCEIEIIYTHCPLKFGIIFCNEKGDRSRIKLESP
jgi:hypothetical protein